MMKTNKRLVLSLLWALVLVASAPVAAWAADWATTFSEESLPSELFEARVVVATGGPGAEEAGRILRQSLVAVGAPLVLENPVMDDIEGISDEEVVRRLSHLPVDAVVILRTFGEEVQPTQAEEPSGDDEEDTEEATTEEATVEVTTRVTMGLLTFYSLDGEAIAGFMVHPGVALTSEQRRRIGRGISQETVDAVAQAYDDKVAGRQTAGRGRDDEARLRLSTAGRNWSLRDRQTHEVIEGAEIYRRLGRDDLAAEYLENQERRRRHSRYGLLTAAAGAGTLALAGIFNRQARSPLPEGSSEIAHCDDFTNERIQQNCIATESFEARSAMRSASWISVGVGLGAVTTGVIMWVRSRTRNMHPVNPAFLRRMVTEENENIARRDQEQDSGQDQPQEQTENLSFEFGPVFVPGQQWHWGLELRLQW